MLSALRLLACLLSLLVCGCKAPSDDNSDDSRRAEPEPIEQPTLAIETGETTDEEPPSPALAGETESESRPESRPEPEPEPPSEPERKPGARKGEVCRSGAASSLEDPKKRSVNRKCQAGLQCCYPCGAFGCDWICATKAQCNSWKKLP